MSKSRQKLDTRQQTSDFSWETRVSQAAVHPLTLKYSMASNDATPVTEVLVTNFSTG